MLPSTKRPKEVEEEKAARAAAWAAQKAEQEKVVLQGSTVENILDGITKWYATLHDKEKRRLTPVAFKRKVVSICFQFGFDYDMLPIDWVKTIKDRCGLKLYERVITETEQNEAHTTQTNRHGSADNERKRRRSTRDISPGPSTKSAGSTEDVDVKPKIFKSSVKKFVDLSNEVPPPFWLQAYAKGVQLPRVLTLYSTDDTNILYYDYNPKLKDSSGNEVKLAPQPRNGTSVIAKLFKKPSDGGDGEKYYRKSKKLRNVGSKKSK